MWSWEQGHSIYSWAQLLGGSSIKARKMNELSRSNIKISLRQQKLPAQRHGVFRSHQWSLVWSSSPL